MQAQNYDHPNGHGGSDVTTAEALISLLHHESDWSYLD